MTPVWRMNDEEYAAGVTRVAAQESVEEAISLMLRESRLVALSFPSYSSGAGDMIGHWLRKLRAE